MNKNEHIFSINQTKFFFTLFLVLLALNNYSQDEYFDDWFSQPHHTNNPSFASPNAANFGKYVDIPVGLYTGVANISVPIYEINTGGTSIPISLSYHSSGIKVEEIASWVGLGWSLNAGGLISRSVKGIPDDVNEITGLLNEIGLSAGPTQTNSGYLYSGSLISDYCNGNATLSEFQYWKLSHGGLDGEPDIFYYNFLNYSGQFIFDFNGNVHFFKENDLKISYERNSNGIIEKFIITTENGVKITFEDIEIARRYPSEFLPDNLFIHFRLKEIPSFIMAPTINSWFMSKIEFPNHQEIITFLYEEEEVLTLKKNRQEWKGNNDYEDGAYNNDLFRINSKRLKEISWSNGKLIFNADHIRQDYDLYQVNMYDGSENICDSKALTSIKLFNNNNDLIRFFELQHSYFEATTDDKTNTGYYPGYSKRLRLDNVMVKNGSDSYTDKYIFEYNTTQLPHRFSYEQDFWGYFNANYTNGLNPEKTLLPNLYYYPYDNGTNDIYNDKYLSPFSIFERSNFSTFEYYNMGADRNPNVEVMEACMLKKIIYPTGGSAEFIYEPNEFYLDGQNIIGGGLRIKKTIMKDGIDPNNDIIKEYTYQESNNNSISSGRAIYIPQFVKSDEIDEDNEIKYFSTSLGGLGNTHGAHVGYKEVTVKQNGNGKVISTFNLPATFGEETADCDESGCIYNRSNVEYVNFISDYFEENRSYYPYPPDPNYDWNRGQIIKEEIYSESNELTKRVEYEYEINEFNSIPALFIKDVHWLIILPPYFWSAYAFSVGKYYYLTAWKTLSKKTATKFYNNEQDNITSITEYFYNSSEHKMLTEKRKMQSNEIITKITFAYPPDIENPEDVHSTEEIINTMVDKNFISPILKGELFSDSEKVEGRITSYSNSFFPEYLLPDKVYSLERDKYQQRIIYDEYDLEGNILQYHNENDINVCYLWGYNYTYPIAKIENASYENDVKPLLGCSYAQLQGKTTDAQLNPIFTQLREGLPNALVSTYTYDPLIGMTSETDPNGVTITYHYDEFGRLETVRDVDEYVLKRVEYHYEE